MEQLLVIVKEILLIYVEVLMLKQLKCVKTLN